ncbi:ATP-grasp domain-containing protein [Pseudovibrio sp. WM33]|uniref:ATP-grasp domain-containing protein n=1 Tax=Pseudovibrio sp. WM33 TaxID=1735585 RepID=UPI0007AEA1FB|nr:ATP-grasp domain-containing protein [Pseudovibrio sp. WM33]KZL24679.1 hypothetical protein PsWM33_02353 [Pseudovibrio sp. WM33]
MPICLLTNPVVNHNMLAKYLIERGVECYAYIDMDQVNKLPPTVKSRGRDFDVDLYAGVIMSKDDLPPPNDCPFHAVIPGGELGVESADQISAYYGLPGNDPETIDYRRDKQAMQNRLAEVGLPSISSMSIGPETKSSEIEETLGVGPYVLKPHDAAGGEALHYCADLSALESAIADLAWGELNCTWKQNHRFVVQKYISGLEYVVDLVARDGEIVVAAISRYIRLSDLGYWSYPNVKRFLVMEDPSDPKFESLIAQAVACCHALGLRQGSAHMEFIDGAQGCFMVEVGARLHGSLSPSLFAECYENDLLGSLYESYFVSDTPLRSGRLRKYGLRSFIAAEEAGVLNTIEPSLMERISSNSSLIAKSITFEAGETFPQTRDEVHTPASGFFANASLSQLFKDVWDFDYILNQYFNGKQYEVGAMAEWINAPTKLSAASKTLDRLGELK